METYYAITILLLLIIAVGEAIALIVICSQRDKNKSQIELLGQILFILRNKNKKSEYINSCWDELNKK